MSDYPEYVLQMVIQGDFSYAADIRARLEGLSPEQRADILRTEYQEFLEKCEFELQQLISSVNPLQLVAMLAVAGHARVPEGSVNPIGNVVIEIAQFLAIRTGAASWNPPAGAYDLRYGKIANLIQQYHAYSALSDSPTLTSVTTHDEKRRLSYIARQHFSTSRSWAYPTELQDLIERLASPLEESLRSLVGYGTRTVIRMWRGVRDRLFSRLQVFDVLRSSVISEGDRTSISRALKGRVEHLGLGDLLGQLEQCGPADQAIELLTREISCLFVFDVQSLHHLAADQEVELSALTTYLDAHSFRCGDLKDAPLRDALDTNPIWKKPIVQLSESSYFIPLPELFFGFAFLHLEHLFETAGLKKRWENRRAKFLEDELAQLISHAFPSGEIFTGVTCAGLDGESDVLARVGNWLIVAEAKSHKLTQAARQGKYKSLEDRIEKLMVDPGSQSARLAAYICKSQRSVVLTTRKGPSHILQIDEICRIIRLTVTLESLGGLSIQGGVLKEIGFGTVDQQIPTTVSITDLAMIFETLPTEEERLDYLFRRSNLQSETRIHAEERDLLVFYLSSTMRAQWDSAQGQFLGLAGIGRILDESYMSRLEGRIPTVYRREYTPLWHQLLELISSRGSLYWPEAACMLLTFTVDEQVQIERDVRQNRTKRKKGVAQNVNSGAWKENFVVWMKAYKRSEIPAATQQLRSEARNMIDTGKADQVLVFILTFDMKPTDMFLLTNRSKPHWI
jgi:hypothetical protein